MRNTPEKVARAHAGLLETVRFLVGAGANLNIQDKVIQPPACQSVYNPIILPVHGCKRENFSCFVSVLQTGKTALMFVAKDNRLDEAKVLVEAGADLNIQDQVSQWVLFVSFTPSFSTYRRRAGRQFSLQLRKQMYRWLSSSVKLEPILIYGTRYFHF